MRQAPLVESDINLLSLNLHLQKCKRKDQVPLYAVQISIVMVNYYSAIIYLYVDFTSYFPVERIEERSPVQHCADS